MKTYFINEENRLGYEPLTDTLYVGYGYYQLGNCTVPELADGHIDVMYGDPDGGFAGATIMDFKETYGDAPKSIIIKVKTPFKLVFNFQ